MFFRLSVGVPELRIIEGPIPFKLDRDDDVVNILIQAVTDQPDYSVVCKAAAETSELSVPTEQFGTFITMWYLSSGIRWRFDQLIP